MLGYILIIYFIKAHFFFHPLSLQVILTLIIHGVSYYCQILFLLH